MADYDSGLPIRTEADGLDERVHSKLVDYADPSGVDKQMEISEKKAHIRVFGKDSDSADQQLRLSQLGAPNPDGDYDATNNKKPASVGMVAHDRNAAVDDTHQNKRLTAVAGADDTICLDVAIRDEAGQPYSGTNPMPVTFEQSEGTEIHDFDQAVAIVKDATSNHDYSVADGVVMQLKEILCSASGKARFELQIGDGAASEAFATKAVVFNSTANPNCPIVFTDPIIVTGTANTTTIRVIKTNLDNQNQDLYSTIVGVEG
jgi:hypothetical protein